MDRLQQILLVKLALTGATLAYVMAPLLSETQAAHLVAANWAPHARFHIAWFYAFGAAIGGLALFLIWARDEIAMPTLLGMAYVFGFWIAALLVPLYGGTVADKVGNGSGLFGVAPDTFLVSVLTGILLGVLAMAHRLRGE